MHTDPTAAHSIPRGLDESQLRHAFALVSSIATLHRVADDSTMIYQSEDEPMRTIGAVRGSGLHEEYEMLRSIGGVSALSPDLVEFTPGFVAFVNGATQLGVSDFGALLNQWGLARATPTFGHLSSLLPSYAHDVVRVASEQWAAGEAFVSLVRQYILASSSVIVDIAAGGASWMATAARCGAIPRSASLIALDICAEETQLHLRQAGAIPVRANALRVAHQTR